jgi:hypothetical protein
VYVRPNSCVTRPAVSCVTACDALPSRVKLSSWKPRRRREARRLPRHVHPRHRQRAPLHVPHVLVPLRPQRRPRRLHRTPRRVRHRPTRRGLPQRDRPHHSCGPAEEVRQHAVPQAYRDRRQSKLISSALAQATTPDSGSSKNPTGQATTPPT